MRVVITIAGSDSGGGAGIQADLKTFEAHGVFGTTAITSITAQNTVGVRAVHDLPLEIIRAQLDAVFDDFPVAAIKIGMLSNRGIIRLVSDFLRERASGIPVVLDPVMVATSGDRLLVEDAVESIRRELAPLATLVTPNAGEATILAGIDINSMDDMREAARRIAETGCGAVLIKGGHLAGRFAHADKNTAEKIAEKKSDEGSLHAIDLLYDGSEDIILEAPYIDTPHTHGTGCTLSSAIAANLANGLSLAQAVMEAKGYVHGAIANAPGLGKGHGPLLHRWRNR